MTTSVPLELLWEVSHDIIGNFPPARWTREQQRTITFRPNEVMGIKLSDKNTGEIKQLKKGQAQDKGVQTDWKLVKINNEFYNHDLYRKIKHGQRKFTVSFSVPKISKTTKSSTKRRATIGGQIIEEDEDLYDEFEEPAGREWFVRISKNITERDGKLDIVGNTSAGMLSNADRFERLALKL